MTFRDIVTKLRSSKITKIFQFNMMTMMTFCDTWRYLVTFDYFS